MKRFVPVAAVSAALLALGAFALLRAREARAAAEPARRLLAELAPDLARTRVDRLRLARAQQDADLRPPAGSPASFFKFARPAAEETSARPVAGTTLELRATALSWPSVAADALSRGIAEAEAAGHKLAAAEIDPARPVGRVRARLVFETLSNAGNKTP